mgnify:CR=1 FL=1
MFKSSSFAILETVVAISSSSSFVNGFIAIIDFDLVCFLNNELLILYLCKIF